MNYNERLEELKKQMLVKNKINGLLNDLTKMQKDLREEVAYLEDKVWNEQKDVDRLEDSSLTSTLYDMLGRKKEKLDKEKLEVEKVREDYLNACNELDNVNSKINNLKKQLIEFQDCESEYQKLKAEKLAAIRSNGSKEAEALRIAERHLADLKNQKQQINEALAEGEKVLKIVSDIKSYLNNAATMGVFDMFSDSFFVDLMKHSQLDKAQELMDQLQHQLKIFACELNDITIDNNIQISIDGFGRFADYWFDNFFTDYMVMQHIQDSKVKIENLEQQIKQIMSNLKEMNSKVDDLVSKTKMNYDAVIDETII